MSSVSYHFYSEQSLQDNIIPLATSPMRVTQIDASQMLSLLAVILSRALTTERVETAGFSLLNLKHKLVFSAIWC